MKKVTFLFAALLIGGLLFTGCKKDPQPTPTPDTPTTTTKVVYKVDNTIPNFTTSDCFKYTLTYVGADGNTVTVNDVSLPWTSPEITVKTLPFNAKIEGEAKFKEEELPDQVFFGEVPTIYVDGSPIANGTEGIRTHSKAIFLDLLSKNPDMLKFSLSTTVQ